MVGPETVGPETVGPSEAEYRRKGACADERAPLFSFRAEKKKPRLS